jgi:tetratricopeptide (TPR) repeat protein
MTALVAHKYMPEQMPDTELRATFTAREHTLDFLVKALRDQIGSRTLTSYLITGPRGSGKTTLVLMLCLRIREDPELATAWLPVRFPEELPAITSLRDLFAAALSVMAEDGIERARAWHEKVEREPDERRSRDLAVTALRRIAEERGRRLILVVENFDQLFERAWAKEEATLRRLLMADPFMLIVGTTVRQFEALRDYRRAFFNYFCDVPLKRLDDEQVKALLVSRAEWDGRPDIAERYRAHEADIRAICRLTGGNARLTVMLYEILSHGDITSVVATLRQLIDQLTPLLKDVLEHQLTDQQRKIIDALMRGGGTATPRVLAGVSRLSLNTVTTQLQRLRDAEIVDVRGGGKGRPAYYFVPDQLLCTWYQMRYLHPHRRRIEMFLELLRTWFKSEEERLEMLKSVVATASSLQGGPLVSAAVVAEYYAASLAATEHERAASDLAVTAWIKTGNLQEAALALAELREMRGHDRRSDEGAAYARLGEWALGHGEFAAAVDVLRIVVDRDPSNTETRLRYGLALAAQGAEALAFECFDEVVRTATDPRVLSLALIGRGVYRPDSDRSGAISDFTAVVELRDAPRESVAVALVSRGASREERGDTSGALADYAMAMELKEAPRDSVARALVNRGRILAEQGKASEAIADYTAVIELKGAPREQLAAALINRGIAHWEQGNISGAIADYTAVVELEGAPSQQAAIAFFGRGFARQKLGDTLGAIADYTAAIELEHVPREAVAAALLNRAMARREQGDTSGAVADYTTIVDLKGAPPAQVARALVNRGVAREQLGAVPAAIADYTAVLVLKGAPVEGVVRALVNRAAIRVRQNDTSGAIADYTAVVELDGAPSEAVARALVGRGFAHAREGDASGAIADYTAVVELERAPGEQVARALINRGLARLQQGDTSEAILDLTAAIEFEQTGPELHAVALAVRGRIFASRGQSDRAFEDPMAIADSPSYSSQARMSAIVDAAAVTGSDQMRLERVCSAARAFVASFTPEQRPKSIVALLGGLSSPDSASVWLRVWRAVGRDQPQDVLSPLAFLDAVAEVLEGRERSVLDPLAPEQREFAQEILRKLQPQADASSSAKRSSPPRRGGRRSRQHG